MSNAASWAFFLLVVVSACAYVYSIYLIVSLNDKTERAIYTLRDDLISVINSSQDKQWPKG